MNETDMTLFQALVGCRVRYRGYDCQVVDILESEQALVLRCENGQRAIQGDQFGTATRRVQGSLTLPCYDPESGELTAAVRDWLQSGY